MLHADNVSCPCDLRLDRLISVKIEALSILPLKRVPRMLSDVISSCGQAHLSYSMAVNALVHVPQGDLSICSMPITTQCLRCFPFVIPVEAHVIDVVYGLLGCRNLTTLLTIFLISTPIFASSLLFLSSSRARTVRSGAGRNIAPERYIEDELTETRKPSLAVCLNTNDGTFSKFTDVTFSPSMWRSR